MILSNMFNNQNPVMCVPHGVHQEKKRHWIMSFSCSDPESVSEMKKNHEKMLISDCVMYLDVKT